MEKVKVTKEQAEEIKDHVSRSSEDFVLKLHLSNPNGWTGTSKVLNGMDITTMAKALYIGYEIEPEFNIGDWVVSKLSNQIGKVTEVKQVSSVLGNSERVVVDAIVNYPDSLRYATPEEIKQEKERIWWAKHGREVWELRKSDILRNLSGDVHEVTSVDGYGMYHIKHVSFPIEKIRKSFKLVCPVENRLDLSN